MYNVILQCCHTFFYWLAASEQYCSDNLLFSACLIELIRRLFQKRLNFIQNFIQKYCYCMFFVVTMSVVIAEAMNLNWIKYNKAHYLKN